MYNEREQSDERKLIMYRKQEQLLLDSSATELMYSRTKSREDFAFHKARNALTATFSNTGSPINRLNVPNSIRKVPTPAVHVTVVSPLGTPCRRLTVP